MARRQFLSQLAALPFFGLSAGKAEQTKRPLKIMMKSAWGSDDPTKAAFVFAHGLALAEAGHEVQTAANGSGASNRSSRPSTGCRNASRYAWSAWRANAMGRSRSGP